MVLIVTIGVTAALLAWRERPEPGAASLTALLGGQVWWAVFYIFELEATTLAGKLFWTNVQWVGVVTIPVAWLLFSLAYTGNDRYLTRRYVLLLSVVPAITIVLAATDSYHTLLYTSVSLVESGQTVRLSVAGGTWFWIIAGYTYLLGLIGSIPLLQLIQRSSLPFRGQSIALLVGTLAPWVSNILYLSGGLPVPGFDPTPVAFSISGVAYLGALTRFQLFGTSPAPNRRARHLVFERLHNGAVVVDSHGYVVDLNESAAAILGTTYTAALGQQAAEIIPKYELIPKQDSSGRQFTVSNKNGSTPYDVTVTPITDFRGRTLGRVIAFHDISDYLRQQQRLEVLNRVLRHNIRTETNLIYGYTDLLETADNKPTVETIKKHAQRIEEMGSKSRAITDIFEQRRSETEAVDVDSVIMTQLSARRTDHPEVRLLYESPDESLSVDSVLTPVVSNLIENAIVHNTDSNPHVEITVTHDETTVEITVADNGPGISEYERIVLNAGTETPLDHGSGLGLWLIAWGADLAGGQVLFAENEPTGSVVTVRVPRLGFPESAASTE